MEGEREKTYAFTLVADIHHKLDNNSNNNNNTIPYQEGHPPLKNGMFFFCFVFKDPLSVEIAHKYSIK